MFSEVAKLCDKQTQKNTLQTVPHDGILLLWDKTIHAQQTR